MSVIGFILKDIALSRQRPTPFIFAAALASISVAACNQAPDDFSNVDQNAINKEAAKATLDQLNQEKEMLAAALPELQKLDPSISELYFSLDDNGERTITVARNLPNGDVETWQADPADVQKLLNDTDQQLQDSPSASASSMLMPMLGGLLAAYMVSNMFSRSAGKSVTASREAHQRQRTMSNNAYSSSVSNKQRQSSMARSLSSSSRNLGSSRGGSFSSSGTRSGSYSSGG